MTDELFQPRMGFAVSPLVELAREKTPARILVGRAGGGYLTPTHLQLRADHAAARDAVQRDLQLEDLGDEFVAQHRLFLVQTAASSKAEFLLRPDLGRCLSEGARLKVAQGAGAQGHRQKRPNAPATSHTSACPPVPLVPVPRTLQIVIGDGLSATAVTTQVPGLLPALIKSAQSAGWNVGQPFVVRYCRVGVMNEIGELLTPDVVVLLIGERPGLATAESLSAYMAYRPQAGDTDAQRNLISNIHARGVSHDAAVVRILDLATQMIERQTSGVEVKERLPAMVTTDGSGDSTAIRWADPEPRIQYE